VTARYSRAASTRRVRLSLYATPTSRSSLRRRRLYLTLSSKQEAFRHVQPLHFHTYYLSLTPPCPNTAQHTPRNADTTRHRHRVRHRVTSPTSRPTRRWSRDTATTVDHGDAALYQRRRLDTRRGLTPTPPLRLDGSRSSRDTRDATSQHLLYTYCLLIISAENLISLLLKNQLFSN